MKPLQPDSQTQLAQHTFFAVFLSLFLFYFLFYIGVQLICNVVLVSGLL